jgi:tRNA threonylcarbamoyladenosine biosynthesis protein TsaB
VKLLAFDTSTQAMSIAVQNGQRHWEHTAEGGANASAALIPAIQSLMAQAGLGYAQLDAIAFGRGPGSFTGVRTACSVAQGLGFGGGVRLLPVDSLMALAEEARRTSGAQRVAALLDARMEEMYNAFFEHDGQAWRSVGEFAVTRPENFTADASWTLAGNVFGVYEGRLPVGLRQVPALPTAAAMLRVAPQLLAAGQAVAADQALPLYIRDKVAKTTVERAAEKAAANP